MPISPVKDVGVALKADVDDYHKAMATAKDGTSVFMGSVQGLARAMRNVGLIMTATGALTAATMASMSRSAARVSEAYREVGSITESSADAQEKYQDITRQLATDFGLLGGEMEAIEGLYQSISAGVDEARESQEAFLQTSAKLAVVGRAELGEAVDLLTTAMNAYGEDVEFASHASEVFFRTVQLGKVRVDELAAVMGRVLAIGSEVGAEIDELGAAMARLTATGFEARIAGTALRGMLEQLARPTENMRDVLFQVAMNQDILSDSARNAMSEIQVAEEAIESYTSELRELQAELAVLEDDQTETQREMTRTQLEMMEIRQRAREADRDLTRREEERLRELQVVLEGLRIDQMRLGLEIDKKRDEEEDAIDTIEEHEEAIKKHEETLEEFQEVIGLVVAEELGFVETFQRMVTVADEMDVPLTSLIDNQRAMLGLMALFGDEGEALVNTLEMIRDEGELSAEEMEGLTEEQIEQINAAEDQEDMMRVLADAMTEEPALRLRGAMEDLRQTWRDFGDVLMEDFFDAVGRVTGVLSSLTDWLDDADDQTRSLVAQFAVWGTMLLLVLGPIMFLTGQLSLIAMSMGASFIPFMLAAGLIVGYVATQFRTLGEAGQAAQSLVDRVTGTVLGLWSGLVTVFDFFRTSILPVLMEWASVVSTALVRGFEIFRDEVLPLLIHWARRTIDIVGDTISWFRVAVLPIILDWASSFASVFLNLIDVLAPVFWDIVNFVTDTLVSAFLFFNDRILPVIAEWGDRAINLIGRVVDWLADSVIPTLRVWAGQILSVLNTIIERGLPILREWADRAYDFITNAFEVLRDTIIPTVQDLVSTAIPLLVNAFEWLRETVIPAVKEIAVVIIGFLTEAFETLREDVIPVLQAFSEDFIGFLFDAFEKLRDDVLPVLLEWGGRILEFIVWLGGVLVDELGEPLLELGSVVVEVFSGLVGGAEDSEGAIERVRGPLQGFMSDLGTLISEIAEFIRHNQDTIRTLISLAIIFGAVLFTAIWIAVDAAGMILGAFNTLAEHVPFLTQAIAILAGALFTQIVLAKAWVAGLFLKAKVLGIVGGILAIYTKAVMALAAAKAFFAAVSMAAIGTLLFWVVVIGVVIALIWYFRDEIVTVINLVIDAIAWFVETGIKLLMALILTPWLFPLMLYEAMSEALDVVLPILGDIFNGFVDVVGNIVEVLWGLPGAFWSVLMDMRDEAVEGGKSLISALIDGIRSSLPDLSDTMSNVASTVSSFLPGSDAEQGDLSTVTQSGSGLTEAFTGGVEGGMSDVEHSMSDFSGTVSSFLPDPSDGGRAQQGALHHLPPEDAGASMGEGFTSGFQGVNIEDDIAKSFHSTPDIESEMQVPDMGGHQRGPATGPGQGETTITIEEGAVTIERGAFQGVAEEELPEKTAEKVEDTFEHLFDRLEGKGGAVSN